MTKPNHKNPRLHPAVRMIAGMLSFLILVLCVIDFLRAPKDWEPVVSMLAFGILFGFTAYAGYAPGMFGRGLESR